MRQHIDPPIAIALDYPSLDDAGRAIDSLADRVKVFKVGLQLFTAAGPAAVEAVHARGCDVFLDLKASDIPNTVAGCVRSAVELGVRFITIHGNAGRESVEAAVEARAGSSLQLLVVSVLTSLDDASLAETGIERPLSGQVDSMAELSLSTGARGLVCGAAEVARVRSAHPDMFLLVPGIRPAWAEADDQKRMGTPAQVVADGADLMVLGRAVTAASDPPAALARVLEELNGVTV